MKSPAPEAIWRPLYPFSSRWLEVDGHRMHYLDEGEGKVVLCVHGNPTWSFYYRKLVRSLRGERRVVVPDHLGCGLSDKPQAYPYTLVNRIRHLDTLWSSLGRPKVDLVAHDWGGAIALGWARHHPDSVGRVILMNTAAFPSRRIPGRIRICRMPLLGALLVRGCNAFAGMAVYMAMQQKRLSREEKAGYLFPYDSWRNRVAVHAFVRDIPMEPDHVSLRELSEIAGSLEFLRSKPVSLLWGGKDFCFNLHFLHEWQARLPEAEVLLHEKAGHYVLEDAPDAVEQITDRLRPGTGD